MYLIDKWWKRLLFSIIGLIFIDRINALIKLEYRVNIFWFFFNSKFRLEYYLCNLQKNKD
jgi:hypothetical protein